MTRPRTPLVTATLAALWLAACGPDAVSIPEVEAFLAAPLPPGHRDLWMASETGIDRLVRLRFDAPEAEADAFARRLVPEGLAAGEDPGLGLLGAGARGWIADLPQGAVGGEARPRVDRVVKVVTAPAGPGLRRVWVAAFTL
ncbi:MAG: hypothetical protein PGN34_00240 [Methylobacterium frigidaeris]